jgi:hypothetical protein
MKPLTLVAWGIIVVLLDLRVGAVDLVPDIAGWSMAVVGVYRLAPAEVRTLAAMGCACVAAALSVASYLEHLEGTRGWLVVLEGAAAAGFVFGLATEIAARSRSIDVALAKGFVVVAWASAALAATGLAVAVGAGGATIIEPQVPVAQTLVALLAVGGVLLGAIFAVMLFATADRPYAVPADFVAERREPEPVVDRSTDPRYR